MSKISMRLNRLKKIIWQLEQLPELFDAKLASLHDKINILNTVEPTPVVVPTTAPIPIPIPVPQAEIENQILQPLRQQLSAQSNSLRWLVKQLENLPPPVPAKSPLVSILIATWNRSQLIENALRSVKAQHYTNWECLIVDDGSTDGTEQAIESWLRDPRFRYFYQPHQDANVARNRGLKEAQGEIITYLDTDNLFSPGWLSHVVSALTADEKIQSVYGGQLVEEANGQSCFLRHEVFDFQKLCQGNFIDLNAFAHRKELVERYGGFDENLDRLQDWDLILRYTEHDPTERIEAVGGIYFHGSPDQMTSTRNAYYNWYLIEKKRQPPMLGPLKVLYALTHYPQLSESYIRGEILAVRQYGVEVEVWSEDGVGATFESEVPVHRGDLSDVVAQFKPDLMHAHWIDVGVRYGKLLKDCDLPVTVRGHGFEFSPNYVQELELDEKVKTIYLFQHFAAQCVSLSSKVKPLPSVFMPEYYFPSQNKDRRLVLRAAASLKTKDLITFFETAKLCPTHRFVLAVARAYHFEFYVDELKVLNESLGNPVEILVDVPLEKISEIIRSAGIYMHTAGQQPFGMPVSICESMATGCYVLARKSPASAAYTGNAGDLYETPEEAAEYIQKTMQWSDDEWKKAAIRSIDQAYKNHVNLRIVRPLVEDWHQIVGSNKNG